MKNKFEELSIIERLNSVGLVIKMLYKKKMVWGNQLNTYIYRLSRLGNIYLMVIRAILNKRLL